VNIRTVTKQGNVELPYEGNVMELPLKGNVKKLPNIGKCQGITV
jgi:hypothetical protein